MELIDILLHRGYIHTSITTLELWNRKKPNARAKEMIEQLNESFSGFDWLESQLVESRRRNKELQVYISSLNLEIEKQKKEIEELKNKLINLEL